MATNQLATAADQLVNTLRDLSRARVAQQPGDYVGIVLQRAHEEGKQPSWLVLPFPTLEALTSWYGDWVGDTASYGYLAAIDRTVSPDPILEAGLGQRRTRMDSPSQALVATSGARTMQYGPGDALSDLQEAIARHDSFWAMVAQKNPRSHLMRWWLLEQWNPFFAKWNNLVIAHGLSSIDIDVISREIAELNALRKLAHEHGVPLPSDGHDPVATRGGMHGGGGHGGGHGGGGWHGGHGGHGPSPIRPRGWGGWGYGGYDGYYDGYYDDWIEEPPLPVFEENGDDDTVVTQGDAEFVRSIAGHAKRMLNDPNWTQDPRLADLAHRPVTIPEVTHRIAQVAMQAAMKEQGMTKPTGRYAQHVGAPIVRDHRSGTPASYQAPGPAPYQSPMAGPVVRDHRGTASPLAPVGAPVGPVVRDHRGYPTTPTPNPLYHPGTPYAQPQPGGYRQPYTPVNRPYPYQGVPANRGRWAGQNQGRYGRGGYYRPGSRWPGRWIHGQQGPTWYEGPENLDAPDDPSASDQPPPSTDDVPVAEQGAAADGGDAGGDQAAADAGDGGVSTSSDARPDPNAAAPAADPAVAQGWPWPPPQPHYQIQRMNYHPEYHHINENPLMICGALAAPFSDPISMKFDVNSAGVLTAYLAIGDRHYTGHADISQLIQEGLRGARDLHNYLHATPTAPLTVGSVAAIRGDIVAVSGGGCGTRTFGGVSQQVIATILQRLQAKGGEITGNNPYRVLTHDHGVELFGTWDQNAATLQLEITNSDPGAPCFAIWNQITDWMTEIGAKEVVSGEQLVRAAGDMIIGSLLERHRQALMGGWWDSVTNAVTSTVKSIGSGAAAVVKKLKTPITVAATAAATVYGGPMAGAAAAKLVGPLMDSAVGSDDPQQQAQSQATVAAAQQQAKVNPAAAQALNIAHSAVTQTAAGFHVAHTIQQAAQGNKTAQKQVGELADAHAAGDPKAKAALDLASAVTGLFASAPDKSSVMSSDYQVDPNLIEMDPPDTSASATVSGIVAGDPRALARTAATAADGKVIGVVIPKDNPLQVQTFATSDDADDWFGQWLSMPHAFEYVAYYDKGDASFPGPLNEQLASSTVAAKTRASGGALPFLLGLGMGAGGAYGGARLYNFYEAHKDHKKPPEKAGSYWHATAMYGAR